MSATRAKVKGNQAKIKFQTKKKYQGVPLITLRMITSAVENKDHDTTRKYAHKIKGAAANVQAAKLSKMAHDLEQAAESKNSQALIEKLPAIQHHIDEIMTLIKHKISHI